MTKTAYALKNCHLIHGDLNHNLEKNMTVLVNEHGLIQEIGKSIELAIPSHYEVIDLSGKYVMPGLINAHVHLFADGKPFSLSVSEGMLQFAYDRILNTKFGKNVLKKRMKRNALTALHAGVTTMRSVGEFFYTDVKLRDEINNGEFVGPNLLVSGFFLSVTGGHGAPFLALVGDSPWEARRNVRINVKNGVDLIKICVTGGVTDAKMVGEAGRLQMTVEEVAAICDEAHKIGLRVAAHVESTEGVRVALKGGVDTIEHGSEMDDEIISLFKNNPSALNGYTALIPTFLAAYPSALLDTCVTNVSATVKENARLVYTSMLKGAQQAIENGITIGLGTDAAMSYVTHYDMWREMDYYIKQANLSNKQLIDMVTRTNAKILGIEEITGTVDIGKQADLIVLDQSPLENIEALSDVRMVMVKGNLIQTPSVTRIQQVDDVLNSVW
ncbi:MULTISPECIES: amidohydrolase family protein [Paenibacillus]|uniref:Amidohydrolase n=1 Tax=Paenibacillus illinoisensis TaxID=59845 RepID=A0A2W0CH71_9BACL|nr:MULTISPECIES: amidohydrolase family protein [Paenibacillus]PAD31014.1 amidohydrolase [Paenibacillus sp. 7523-1]PYY30189.1 Amidohydrolase [Paenibacillus illinoisensis]